MVGGGGALGGAGRGKHWPPSFVFTACTASELFVETKCLDNCIQLVKFVDVFDLMMVMLSMFEFGNCADRFIACYLKVLKMIGTCLYMF